jgi:hypothetical protein
MAQQLASWSLSANLRNCPKGLCQVAESAIVSYCSFLTVTFPVVVVVVVVVAAAALVANAFLVVDAFLVISVSGQ